MPSKPRMSSHQRAIRKSALPDDRQALYELHPRQVEFMESDAEEVLFGGAMAGGKSYALRCWGVSYCLQYPGADVALFRRTYRQLEDTHALSLQREVPEALADYKSGSHDLVFKNGSILMLRHAEEEDDIRKYYSSEWDALLIDEIEEFTMYQYSNLVSRVRSSKEWWPGRRIRVTGMPLGVGHAWVRARWIDNAQPNTVWTGSVSEGGMTREFIPAQVTDNPSIMSVDPNYVNSLRALPEEEYRARALGDWSVSSGQFFTRWRDDVHLVEPFDIPPDWDKYICHDYGFAAPAATLWFARPPGTQSAFFYREHYGAGVKLEEQIHRAWQEAMDSGESIRAIILDPSEFGKVNVKGERVDSMADEWKKVFGSTTKVVRGNNDRIPGWRLMREMVDWQELPTGGVMVPPLLHVFRTCPNLARTIPVAVADEDNPEDVDTDCEDHAIDAARYGLRHAFQGGGQQGRIRRYFQTPKGIVAASV